MGKTSSQEDNALGFFLLYHFHGRVHLIFPAVNPVQKEGIPSVLDLLAENFYHSAEKWIVNAFDKDHNGSGNRPFQVSRAVVGDVIVFPDNLKDHIFCLLIDIRVIVDGPGHGADAYTADPGHIFDGNTIHVISPFSLLLLRQPRLR